MSRNTVRYLGAIALLSILLVGGPNEAIGQAGPARIVISQVYAAGGEQFSTYRSDFVEIFNQGGEPISLNGWTLEYAPGSTGIWSQVEVLGWTLEPGQSYFVDAYNQEYNRDIEPMQGGHTDNYYYQMISYIRRYKGVREPPTARRDYAIAIDGRFEDWRSVEPEYPNGSVGPPYSSDSSYDGTITSSSKSTTLLARH